ncbi:MAG TPA: FAD-binding oxidoreductase [Thermoanaerobaculia bacterium]|nr:FAD-binding oxidoreductase [Thermoanaerobaculia bacterium]
MSPEILIVGGGVMGASTAWHLASRGCRDVLVLDRGPEPGAGSTGRATGGFRTQFATEINIRLSLLSREKLLRFSDEVGADPGYRPRGYLFLAADEAQLATLRSLGPLQRSLGVEVQEVDPEDIRRLNPAIEIGEIPGGTFGPQDGFIRPLDILRGYTDAARRLGVRFEYGVDVLGVEVDGARATGVRTARETITAGHVVNAAGAWAAGLARTAGVEIPVAPVRRQVAPTELTGLLPEDMPMTIFLEDGFHLRVRDGRVLLLWPEETPSSDPFDTSFDPRWLDGLIERAHARVPRLREARLDRDRCWAGLYEMTPDKHTILGPAPGVDGFWLLTGSSGHGVMHSPALGHLAAELILDGTARSLDVQPLRPTRFAEGAPNPEVSLL